MDQFIGIAILERKTLSLFIYFLMLIYMLSPWGLFLMPSFSADKLCWLLSISLWSRRHLIFTEVLLLVDDVIHGNILEKFEGVPFMKLKCRLGNVKAGCSRNELPLSWLCSGNLLWFVELAWHCRFTFKTSWCNYSICTGFMDGQILRTIERLLR